MYRLTQKGQEELERYSDATEDDLRVTRRTLMYPVLRAVSEDKDTSFYNLCSSTGLSRYEMTGVLRDLLRLGYMDREDPGPNATKEEKRSWYMYQVGQKRGKKPESRTKEQLDESTQRYKERYPEVFQRDLDDYDLRFQKSWFDKRGGRSKYLKELRESKPEYIERKKALQDRNDRVLSLRSSGLSESQIAKEVSMSQSGVSGLLRRLKKD